MQQDQHVARRQTVNPQFIESRLWRGVALARPACRLLCRLFEKVPQQQGRAHVKAQDDTGLLNAEEVDGG